MSAGGGPKSRQTADAAASSGLSASATTVHSIGVGPDEAGSERESGAQLERGLAFEALSAADQHQIRSLAERVLFFFDTSARTQQLKQQKRAMYVGQLTPPLSLLLFRLLSFSLVFPFFFFSFRLQFELFVESTLCVCGVMGAVDSLWRTMTSPPASISLWYSCLCLPLFSRPFYLTFCLLFVCAHQSKEDVADLKSAAPSSASASASASSAAAVTAVAADIPAGDSGEAHTFVSQALLHFTQLQAEYEQKQTQTQTQTASRFLLAQDRWFPMPPAATSSSASASASASAAAAGAGAGAAPAKSAAASKREPFFFVQLADPQLGFFTENKSWYHSPSLARSLLFLLQLCCVSMGVCSLL